MEINNGGKDIPEQIPKKLHQTDQDTYVILKAEDQGPFIKKAIKVTTILNGEQCQRPRSLHKEGDKGHDHIKRLSKPKTKVPS
jgi:hypothetical protein